MYETLTPDPGLWIAQDLEKFEVPGVVRETFFGAEAIWGGKLLRFRPKIQVDTPTFGEFG